MEMTSRNREGLPTGAKKPKPNPPAQQNRVVNEGTAKQDVNARNQKEQANEDDDTAIVPKSTDEPPVICRLSSAKNAFNYVEMCGWTRMQPLNFINLQKNFKLKEVGSDPNHGNYKKAKDIQSKCLTLAEMNDLAGAGTIPHPNNLQVIAKKKVDAFVFNNKLMIIPLVIVADKSGYCVVCGFNEGVETFYNQVDIGDVLILTSCLPQKPRRTYHKGIFSDAMFLDLELKIAHHSVGAHYISRFDPLKLSEFRFHETLFTNKDHLKLPSELEEEIGTNVPWVSPEERYNDLAGVISYVSRIQRHRTAVGRDNAEYLVDGKLEFKIFQRYITYRYISLVDKTSKPFTVKLTNLDRQQGELVPGAIIVVSHCQIPKERHSTPFCQDSYFSTIYVGHNVHKYCMLHPDAAKQKLQEILSYSNYTEIISRKDICWSAGGMLQTKIVSETLFHQFYNNKPNDFYTAKLARRESMRWFFSGIIFRAFKAETDDCPLLYFAHKRYGEMARKKAEFKYVEHYETYDFNKNVSWFSYIRKMPPFSEKALQMTTSQAIEKEIVADFKKYCSPLLLPAEVPAEKFPPLADLERVDGPPYFLLDIIDETNSTWHKCIWKTSNEYTIEEMARKIDLTKGKKILCSSELFCLEDNTPLEFVLYDFVVDPSGD